MNSTYVTFGDFNKPEPPPPHMNESFEMGSYDQQRSNHFPQQSPQQPGRYPIRQHMTQPRNPYTPQMLPPYPRNEMPGSRYNDAPPMMMMPQPPPPPLNMPFPQRNMVSLPPSSNHDFDMPSNATPIGKAFSEEFDMPMSSSKDETGNGYQREARMNRLLDATCVDINDHIMNCPICSKYYQNHTTVYVGIIILLGFIILIFLLKSIMEIKR